MVAQRGTLRFQAQGAYLLVSLPVSAFRDFDEDGDHRMSEEELARHRGVLSAQVIAGVQLLRGAEPLPLEGMLLNLSRPHHQSGPADQIVIMGRFKTPEDGPLRFQLQLFGGEAVTQQVQLRITRRGIQSEVILSPQNAGIQIH